QVASVHSIWLWSLIETRSLEAKERDAQAALVALRRARPEAAERNTLPNAMKAFADRGELHRRFIAPDELRAACFVHQRRGDLVEFWERAPALVPHEPDEPVITLCASLFFS